MTEESEKINLENASAALSVLTEAAAPTKKPRKEFEWTPKRKEAFDKMRKGLDDKIKLTKKIKEEKKRSEKDAIKAKVREIMNSKKGVLTNVESDSSSEAESSESEHEKKKKSSKKKKEEKPVPVKVDKKSKSKRKQADTSEEEESSDESEPSEDEEERRLAVQRDRFSSKQRHQYQKDKVERGKAVKVAQFVNPLDQFILL